jgi:hypothetical protein
MLLKVLKNWAGGFLSENIDSENKPIIVFINQ